MTKGIVQTACREGAVEWHVRHASRQEEKSEVNKNDGTLCVTWPKRQ